MDFPGIGDSEGVIKDFHFDRSDISDTLQAIDILTQETKIEKVVLLGICSGARDAIKAAAKDLRVDAVILWSLPIITDVRNNVISSVCANNYLKGWIKRSFSIKAWKRFLSHNNSSPSVRSVLWKLLTGRKIDEDNKYGEFFESFESFISSRRKALFVYGERDEVVLEEFQVKFEGLSEGNRNNCEYYVVPNGDHTFTSIEAEGNVIEKTVKWLTQKYELNMEMLEE